MLAATLIAIFIIPVTFYVSERLGRRFEKPAAPAGVPATIQGGSDDRPRPDGGRP
jgi:hypothetical protein